MKVSKPHRVIRTAVIRVAGSADAVFALFCPVREADWLDGWAPLRVYSESGVAEPGCAFVSADGDREVSWLITEHDPSAGRVEMVKLTPGITVCLLRIEVQPAADEASTVTVTYTHTALGEAGVPTVDAFTEDKYAETMAHWQRALEHYLSTGERLAAPAR